MFYPAGEEPTFGDDSSDDECYVFNGGIEEAKTVDVKTNFSWSAKTDAVNDTKVPQRKEHVFAQTSMMNEDFRMAIIKGDKEKVSTLLASGFDIECRLKGSWTPLMYACESGNSDVIELLLDAGANPNSHKDTFTALMCLCTCKNVLLKDELSNSAKLMIEKGARVNARDRHYMSPLMYACQLGHTSITEVLISSSAHINCQDSRGWTSLCYAAVLGNESLVTLLMSHGGSVTLSTHLGDTPSSLALGEGFCRLADILDGKCTKVIETTNYTETHRLTAGNDYGVGSRKLGDLELFLAGLKLQHLESIFESHCIDFDRLLTLTDNDLDDMGIQQIGVKRSIMDAITDLHKSRWKMPDKPFEVRRGLSIQEYSTILCQLESHIRYVAGSTAFLIKHTSKSDHSPIAMVTTDQEHKELTNQIDLVTKASKQLAQDIEVLENKVQEELGRSAVNTNLKLVPMLKAFGLISGLSLCGMTVYCFFSGNTFPFPRVHLSSLFAYIYEPAVN